MHGSEVSTAVAQKAGAIWVVWSENDYNMVSQGMGIILKEPAAYDHYYQMGQPDIQKIAEGYGAEACTVTTPAEFEAAFLKAIEGGRAGRPQVIAVKEDHDAVPPFYINQYPWIPTPPAGH
jgi:acetolactate synthase-1/2/3 large subunit